MIAGTKTPTKRKSFSNKLGKKGSPKKAKLEDVKTPQKNKSLEKITTPQPQNSNKKLNLQGNQTSTKKSKKNIVNASANGSQKKLKPFSGTSDIAPLLKKKQQPEKSIEKKDGEVEKGGEKRKRRNQYFTITSKVNSGDKQEALKDIENKIKAIQSRGGELTKTAKRKIKRLNHLKKICEGKPPVQGQQKNNSDGPSVSTKHPTRKQKVALKAENQTKETKTNGKANKSTEIVKKQAAKNMKLVAKLQDSDDDEESGDDSDEESGNGEEVAVEQDSDEENESDEAESGEEEESEQDDEESDEESEEESPPKIEDKRKKKFPEKKGTLKKIDGWTENKSKNIRDVDLEQLKKENLLNKNQKRFVLFIGNIPYDTNKTDLSEHFKKCGEIKHIRIPTEKNSSKPRGFAYVEVGNEDTYQKCLSIHHSFLKGRRINVLYTQGGKKKGDDKKKEIKTKNFKLHAMRKQGKLAGSKKENQKRSFRRAKQNASNKESDMQM